MKFLAFSIGCATGYFLYFALIIVGSKSGMQSLGVS